VHTGEFVIIGIYQTTGGQELLWFKKGKEPPLPQEFWRVKDNPLVTTIAGDEDDCPEN
jgi:hypothetical protein